MGWLSLLYEYALCGSVSRVFTRDRGHFGSNTGIAYQTQGIVGSQLFPARRYRFFALQKRTNTLLTSYNSNARIPGWQRFPGMIKIAVFKKNGLNFMANLKLILLPLTRFDSCSK